MAQSKSASGQNGISGRIYGWGLVFLVVATVAAFMLVLEHVSGISLPGCAEDSPCAKTVASAWGTVPVIDWPTSFLGFTYFLGVLLAWLLSRGAVSVLFRSIVRLGALASVFFLLLIAVKGYYCQYCLVSHVGNLAFWLIVERAPRAPGIAWRRPVLLAGAFLAASVVLGIFEYSEREAMFAREETARTETRDRILAAGERSREEGAGSGGSGGEGSVSGTSIADRTEEGSAADRVSSTDPWSDGFTGRYRLGPEKASVRIVAFTDYQCRDCKRLEKEMLAAVEQNESVSLSIKHFPMSADCNPYFPSNMHPNACWAARAAEAAGILKGTEGFFAMHRWLFGRGGAFTNPELQEGLREMGFDPARFIEVMSGPETLQRVQGDIEEAMWLGLHYTPMIFVNGVEFKGIFAPDALTRTVAELLAEDLPARMAAADSPPPARQKIVEDWLAQPERAFDPDQNDWTRGAEDARVRIMLWGDYQEPYTAEADSVVLAFLQQRDDVSYSFRHFPVNQECNPLSQMTKHPLACLASRAAEAAGQVGGQEAYWEMHGWLFDHQDAVTPGTVEEKASAMGLDRGAFRAALRGRNVEAAIRDDCLATRQLALRSIPAFVVNERYVPRYRYQDEVLLHLILEEAARE